MKTITLLFIIIFALFPMIGAEATTYPQLTNGSLPFSERTYLTTMIHERDKQIEDLQITDKLSLSVALVFGIVAIYSEIKRRKSDKKLRDLISNETDKILNTIKPKHEAEQKEDQ